MTPVNLCDNCPDCTQKASVIEAQNRTIKEIGAERAATERKLGEAYAKNGRQETLIADLQKRAHEAEDAARAFSVGAERDRTVASSRIAEMKALVERAATVVRVVVDLAGAGLAMSDALIAHYRALLAAIASNKNEMLRIERDARSIAGDKQ